MKDRDIVSMPNGSVRLFDSIFQRILMLSAVSLVLAACSITDTVNYEDREGQIPQRLFEDIEDGRIETQEILEQLGDPVLIEQMSNDVSVMTYRFSRVQIRNLRLLYVFRAGARADDQAYYHVAYKGEEIRKTWVDDSLRVENVRKFVQKVDPPEKKKSGGFNWKLPFFKSKQAVMKTESTVTPESVATANTHDGDTSNGADIGSASTDSISGEDQQSDESGISADPADEPEQMQGEDLPQINPDAMKLDLTL